MSEIKIDGLENEEAWQAAEVADHFWQNWPYDSSAANSKTYVKLLYNDQYLYILAKCYQVKKKDFIIETLKRDFNFRSNDAFAIHIDPFQDGNNGFIFSISAAGAQMEGLIIEGQGRDYNWDNVWYGKVSQHDDYYVAEMAIPWKSIRFNPNITQWSVNFIRNDFANNEMSSWQALPRNLPIESLAYTGTLHFDELPDRKNSNVVLIPYLRTNYNENILSEPGKISGSGGADAKIAVSPSLNLDLTLNPDFSETEVDKQVINLERFDILFPEKRTFFLENSDLFANLGTGTFRPFFSRRIGLYKGSQIPILFGARLSGKINQNWRIGLMDIQTEGVQGLSLNSQNFGALVLQRQILKRSNITGFYINKQDFQAMQPIEDIYNRIAGGEFNYYSNNGKITGKLTSHIAFSPEAHNLNTANAVSLSLNEKSLRIGGGAERVQKNYVAETGFVPRLYQYDEIRKEAYRLGYYTVNNYVNYYFYPKSDKIVYFGPQLSSQAYWDDSLRLNESLIGADLYFFNVNRSTLNFGYRRNFIRLLNPTNITGTMVEMLPATGYINDAYFFNYASDPRRNFSFSLETQYGKFFTGNKTTITSSFVLKASQWGRFSANASYNLIDFPSPNGITNLWLVGPQAQLFFNTKLAFTTFVQYNTQLDNLNINARLQYEIRPLSFFYLVYTDNYLPETFSTKSRALVAKFNYWFSL